MPDLNYDNPAVKDSMFSISDFWINDIGVDGFRQDAVLYIHEDGSTLKNTTETLQFWQDFNTNFKAANPDAFAVGEAWEATDIALQFIKEDRLDFVFEFDLAQAILNGVNNETAAPIISQMQKVYDAYPFLQYGTFLTNHDQDRVMNVLGQDIEKAKLAASLYLTLPGIPYIYYGEEVGMLGEKPDPDIRLPMQWSDQPNTGFSENQPWRSIYSNYEDFNVKVMEEDENSLLSHYKKLIHARNSYPELSIGKYEAGIGSEDGMLVFAREDEYSHSPVLIVINLTGIPIENASVTFTKELFPYGPAFGSYYAGEPLEGNYNESEEIIAPFSFHENQQKITQINVEPYSTLVIPFDVYFTHNETETSPQSFALHQNYPNPFNPTTTISFYLPKAENVKLKVFDITGRLVSTLVEGRLNAGNHSEHFDASSLSSSVYFYQLEAGSFSSVQKMTLIK